MREFKDALVEARLASGYDNQDDIARAIDIPRRTYTHYENGNHFPPEKTLERIILYVAVPDNVAAELRELRKKGVARRAGIEVEVLSVNVDVSVLSEKIQREVVTNLFTLQNIITL